METWSQELQLHKALPNSFEGWYFRISDRNCSMAIIVGISNVEDDSHCFIQTIDTISKKTQYLRYHKGELRVEKDTFKIQIQDNIFTSRGMILHLENGDVCIHGALAFQNLTKLDKTHYAPTIMGPFAYFANMECVHAIISTHHQVSGNLRIQGKDMLIHGSGYIEKDRGVSFPKQYIWIQSNECEEGKATLFVAIAHIPMPMFHFQGVIALLQVKEQQFRFGSYYGARVQTMKHSDDELYFIIKQGRLRLHVQLYKNERYPLIAPRIGEMGPKVMEGLNGKVTLRLLQGHKLLASLHFLHCGNEDRWTE